MYRVREKVVRHDIVGVLNDLEVSPPLTLYRNVHTCAYQTGEIQKFGWQPIIFFLTLRTVNAIKTVCSVWIDLTIEFPG